jgi:hypothetical protein
MSKWSEQEKTLSSEGKFLKFDDGESVDIHILNDEPVSEISHGFGKTKAVCNGNGQCAACTDGDYPKERWKTNVLIRASNKVKIWEFGWGVMSQIKEIAGMLEEEGKTLESVDLRVKASGDKLERKYTIVQKASAPMPEGLELHELK